MKTILDPLLTTLVDLLRSRALLHLEMLALRQQLAMVTSRDNKRHRFRLSERIFWVWLYYGLPAFRRWQSSSQILWSVGIARGFGCVGPGILTDGGVVDQLLIPMCAN